MNINVLINILFNYLFKLKNIKNDITEYFYQENNKNNKNKKKILIKDITYISDIENKESIVLNRHDVNNLQSEFEESCNIDFETIIFYFLKNHKLVLSENFIVNLTYNIDIKQYMINIDKENSTKFIIFNTFNKPSNNLNHILCANIFDKTDDEYEYDLTGDLEKYAGPNKDFHKSNGIKMELKNLLISNNTQYLGELLNENRYIEIQDILLNEYKIEYPFDEEIKLINEINQKSMNESKRNGSLFMNDFINRGIMIRLKEIFYNFVGK
jgi:hypothetical protein